MIALIALFGCGPILPMEPDQPCMEAGYAIASRTFDCTGDGDLANARMEAFLDHFDCVEIDITQAPAEPNFDDTVNHFHCAYAIDALTCEAVESLGDDIAAWLSVSPSCPYVVEAADGERYWVDAEGSP